MIYAFLDYELDVQLYELRRGGEALAIEPQVYDVLMYLIQNSERVVPKLELLERLWPDRYVSDGALSHCVMLARKAIGDNGQSQHCIKTVHRRGYRFIAKVRRELPGAAVRSDASGVQALSLEDGAAARPPSTFPKPLFS
jgi:DNA-binding winged helix-turn-helix (wHTH) protein